MKADSSDEDDSSRLASVKTTKSMHQLVKDIESLVPDKPRQAEVFDKLRYCRVDSSFLNTLACSIVVDLSNMDDRRSTIDRQPNDSATGKKCTRLLKCAAI